MKIKDWIHFFRIELLLFAEALFLFCGYIVCYFLELPLSRQTFYVATILAAGAWLIVFIPNLIAFVFSHKRHFCSVFSNMSGTEMQSKYRTKAMHPPVAEELLQKQPEGIIFGRVGMKYVRKPIDQDGHVFVIGGSGSGKSSCVVIPTLLANTHTSVFAVDIKGELHSKATKRGDRNIKVFDPADRHSFGYDPFYRISKSSTNQEIYETMQLVTNSLIPLPASVKDPFWKQSARNLLLGLLIYFYNLNFDNLIDIVDQIKARPIQETMKEVLEHSPHESMEYKILVQFNNMADVTISGIFMEMNLHLNIFCMDEDIRYAFRDNYLHLSPKDLEDGKSIYLAIREDKLSAYYDVLQLIINQFLSQLETRPEDSDRIVFIIDELPRILSTGKLDKLMDAVHTLRSRKVTLVLISQSVEALTSAYSENEVVDIISNCSYVEVLSAASKKTQEMIVAWCGKYKEKKSTWSGGITKREHYTMEENDIVRADDLMRLQLAGDAIVVTPYGYFRVKKVPYYKDVKLKKLEQETKDYNECLGGN